MSTPSASHTPRGDRKRARILAAAREVFGEKGYGATIKEIADRAGVAYGSVSYYFKNKDGLFFAVADLLFEEMTRIDPLPSAGERPADLLRRVHRAYYEAYVRNARLMGLIEHVATFHDGFRDLRAKHRAAFIERSAWVIGQWQAAGLIRPDLDPDPTARALAAMIDHSLYLCLVQGEGPSDVGRLCATLDRLTLHAFGLAR